MTPPSHLGDRVRPLICPQVVRGRGRHQAVRDAVCFDETLRGQRRQTLLAIAAASTALATALILFVG